MKKHQFSLTLIQHEVNNSLIEQRAGDGYINATQLCSAAKKFWNAYNAQEATRDFMKTLATKMNIGVAELVYEELKENSSKNVWVHPKVAIHLAQWLSAEFAVQVSEWIIDWLSGKGAPRKSTDTLPYHIQRHMLNLSSVPAGYFSVLQEMTFSLIAPLEQNGYELPEHMVPDISMGRFLCKHLREKIGIDTDSLPVYIHRFPDGRTVEAKIYPNNFLPVFRKIIHEEWLPHKAEQYFKERDPLALPHLDQVVLALPGPVNEKNYPRINGRRHLKK